MTTLFVSRPVAGDGANGSSTEPPRPVIPSGPVVPPSRCRRCSCRLVGGGSGRVGGAGGRREQQRERHGARPPPHRRKDQSLLPTKLSGVTRMIAIACAGIAPTPSLDEHVEDDEVRAERERRDDEEPRPLVGDAALVLPERPEPVQRVVVRHRDEERPDRGRR